MAFDLTRGFLPSLAVRPSLRHHPVRSTRPRAWCVARSAWP